MIMLLVLVILQAPGILLSFGPRLILVGWHNGITRQTHLPSLLGRRESPTPWAVPASLPLRPLTRRSSTVVPVTMIHHYVVSLSNAPARITLQFILHLCLFPSLTLYLVLSSPAGRGHCCGLMYASGVGIPSYLSLGAIRLIGRGD